MNFDDLMSLADLQIGVKQTHQDFAILDSLQKIVNTKIVKFRQFDFENECKRHRKLCYNSPALNLCMNIVPKVQYLVIPNKKIC